jgi:hypothetical protein
MPPGVYDRLHATFCAAKLDFGMSTDIHVFEHVFSAAVAAGCLHGLKLARLQELAVGLRVGLAVTVT